MTQINQTVTVTSNHNQAISLTWHFHLGFKEKPFLTKHGVGLQKSFYKRGRGGGGRRKNLPWGGGGGVWIFSGTTIVFLSNGIFRSQSGGRLKIDK